MNKQSEVVLGSSFCLKIKEYPIKNEEKLVNQTSKLISKVDMLKIWCYNEDEIPKVV